MRYPDLTRRLCNFFGVDVDDLDEPEKLESILLEYDEIWYNDGYYDACSEYELND